MQYKKLQKLLLISITILVSLTACSSVSSIRNSWICVSPDNGFDCRYTLFTGREIDTMRIEEAESISLSYDVEVKSGSLQIKLIDPSDQILWHVDLVASDSNEVEIASSESGRYIIIVTGDKAEGYFKITWDTTN